MPLLDLGDKLKLVPTDDDQAATSILDIDVGEIDANGSKEQTLYVIGRTTPLTRILSISVRQHTEPSLGSLLQPLYKSNLNCLFYFWQIRYKPSLSNQEPYFEKHETVKIHYNKAFEIKFHTHEQESERNSERPFPPHLEEKERLLVIAAIRCTSPWNLQVDSIETEQDEVRHVRYQSRTNTPIDPYILPNLATFTC
jgi:hypothetical protein